MKKEIADKWVAELRSGKYKQGEGYLKKAVDGPAEHCCLGVLCELAQDEGIVKEDSFKLAGTHVSNVFYKFGPESEILPAGVVNWANMNDCNGTYNATFADDEEDTYVHYTCLTELNDEGKMSFGQIADFIEHYWEEL